MDKIRQYIMNSPSKDYYEKQIALWEKSKIDDLENLLQKFEENGAKNPFPWAFSEINEGIPQLARYLVLKNLINLAINPDDNLNFAHDLDPTLENKLSNLPINKSGNEVSELLKSYSFGLIYNVISLLDEGNSNWKKDGLSWSLVKIDEDLELTKTSIFGLRESFMEIYNETK